MYHIAEQIIPYMSALGSAKEQKQIEEFNIKLQRKYRFSLSARATHVIRLEDQEFILCGADKRVKYAVLDYFRLLYLLPKGRRGNEYE